LRPAGSGAPALFRLRRVTLATRGSRRPCWLGPASPANSGATVATLHPFSRRAHSGVTSLRHFALRFGVPRPRPPDLTEAIGRCGHCGRTCHDRPISEPSGSAAGTSPEVFVPFSADQPRRALAPGRQPTVRTIPLRPFASAGPALSANLRPAYAVPLRVYAVSEIGSGIARLMDDYRGGSFGRRQRAVCCNRVCSTTTGHAFVDREDAIPVVIDASRQALPAYPVRALAAHPAK
jgi:hypothetical protein